MPGMDGYQTAREIRSRDGASALKLIALTGWGQDSDRTRSREAGINHHLVKPVELQALEEALRQAEPAAPIPR
jgi:CheY-like chemotaxis protein